WSRLLGLYVQDGRKAPEPATLRYRLWGIPARIVRHARQRILKISPDWPWKEAFLTCWHRLHAMPEPPDQHEPPLRQERSTSPARSEPAHAPGTPGRDACGHADSNQTPQPKPGTGT